MEELAWSNFGAAKTNGVIYWAVLNIYYYILIIAKTNNYSTAIPDRNARILGGWGARGDVVDACSACSRDMSRVYACMHVCMCACMYVCVHVYMYACMHVCMYVCMHA